MNLKSPEQTKSYETAQLPVIENPEQYLLETNDFIDKLKAKEKLSMKELENILETKKYILKEDYGFTLVTKKKIIEELNFLLSKGIIDQSNPDYKPKQNFEDKLSRLIPDLNKSLGQKNTTILDLIEKITKKENKLDPAFLKECENESQRLIIIMSMYQIEDTEFCEKLSLFIESINLLYKVKEL